MAFDPRRARIGAILFLLASQSDAQKPEDLTAVVAQIEGQVTLSPEGRAEFRSVRHVAQRQIIRRGESVHVPTGAQVTLICSTETLVNLTGPGEWVLDSRGCGQGLSLPENSYRNLASYAGRILPRNGALLLELETRYVEVGLGAILLSPRNTVTMDANPRLVWTRVPDALEYEIKLRGPIETSIRLAADEIQCGQGSGPWRGLDVCSWAPSGKWPALEREKPVALSFGSRQTSTAPFSRMREMYRIHLWSVNDQRSVQENLHQFDTLPVDKASRLLLIAGVYAKGGLYADAIATYDEALQVQEMPEARVTLGDLYLTVGLTALADREYRQVLAGAPQAVACAAAELGLGQVAYFRKFFDDARSHFERASEIYTSLGLPVEAEDARVAASRFQTRGRDDLP
jgi:tetratricopeptide (TPR) repeat protein